MTTNLHLPTCLLQNLSLQISISPPISPSISHYKSPSTYLSPPSTLTTNLHLPTYLPHHLSLQISLSPPISPSISHYKSPSPHLSPHHLSLQISLSPPISPSISHCKSPLPHLSPPLPLTAHLLIQVYREYTTSICYDMAASKEKDTSSDYMDIVSRRMGLSILLYN